MKQAKKRALWSQRIQQQKMSGISQKKYCEQNNLNVIAFRYHKKKALHKDDALDSSNNTNLFIPIKQEGLSIRFKDVELSFPSLPAPQWIASVIKSLEASHAQS